MSNTMEWKTIDSAPKDGASVMLYVPRAITHKIVICHYRSWAVDYTPTGRAGVWQDRTSRVVYNATHWMPLPPKPNTINNDNE